MAKDQTITLTFLEAKVATIKKWRWMSTHQRNFGESHHNYFARLVWAIPELANYNGGCGFCQYFKMQTSRGCILCPLANLDQGSCQDSSSPYAKWAHSIWFLTKWRARKVLEAIEKCEFKEEN